MGDLTATALSFLWLIHISGGVSTTHSFSTRDYSTYTAAVFPDSISGITIRQGGDSRVHLLEDFTFSVDENDIYSTVSAYNGLDVDVKIADLSDDSIVRTFYFTIKFVSVKYGVATFHLQDRFAYNELYQDFPLYDKIADIWPSTKLQYENITLPLVFGSVYMPVFPIYTGSAHYYVMGVYGSVDWTIDKAASPREKGADTTWLSSSYTFTQSNLTPAGISQTVRVVRPIIADSDGDGTADAVGLFPDNGKLLPLLLKYHENRSGGVVDNPADVLDDYILPTTSIANASAISTYNAWGLEINGSIFVKKPRAEYLSSILKQCHAVLGITLSGGREHRVLSKTSVDTADSSNIIEDTFSFRRAETIEDFDGVYVAFPESGAPADILHKAKVPISGSSSTKPADDTLECPYVSNSRDAQRLGTLWAQRKYGITGVVGFTGAPEFITLDPDDVITISGSFYGAATTFDVVITQLTIDSDFLVNISANRYAHDLDDWTDLSPSAISLASETVSDAWYPLVIGPLATSDSGNPPNVFEGGIGLDWIRARTSLGLSLGDDAGRGPMVNDGGAVTNVYQPGFLAVKTTEQTDLVYNGSTVISFPTEITDQGGDFASSTFTAPFDGSYDLGACIEIYDVDVSANYYTLKIKTTNRDYYKYFKPQASADFDHMSLDIFILGADMDANDTAKVWLSQYGGASQTDVKGTSSQYVVGWFCGRLAA